MENASKALLIAGAILIAILLIAIGMMAFRSATGVINTATSGMSDYEKTLHNDKFTMYNGRRNGSAVTELMEVVKTNNANSSNVKVYLVNVKNNNGSATEDSFKDTPVNVKTYDVECITDSNGVVTNIYINEVGKTN